MLPEHIVVESTEDGLKVARKTEIDMGNYTYKAHVIHYQDIEDIRKVLNWYAFEAAKKQGEKVNFEKDLGEMARKILKILPNEIQ